MSEMNRTFTLTEVADRDSTREPVVDISRRKLVRAALFSLTGGSMLAACGGGEGAPGEELIAQDRNVQLG